MFWRKPAHFRLILMKPKQTAKKLPKVGRNDTNWWVFGIMLVAAFILYGNTIGNQYCLDDSIVVTRNKFVDKGLDGIPDIFTTESFTGFFGQQKDLVSGSRYRPLSIATFAIEKEVMKGYKPAVSHFINILLFAFTGVFIYLLFTKILPVAQTEYKLLPLVASLLFMFHPIHTEVVANIKGRDEIMALLFSLAACFLMLRFNENKRWPLLIASVLLWFLALLSKENAMAFLVLMPLMLYITGARKVKLYLKPMLAFGVVAVLFMVIRHAVIGSNTGISDELMNNSFLQATASQKYATIFVTLWKYIQLLFFPHPLTFDYYPYHIALVSWSNILALAGLVSYLALIGWLAVSLRKNLIVAFALIFYLLPLLPVSNLFFPIGVFMSERFIYFSSVGFCILTALGLLKLVAFKPSLKYMVFGFMGVVLILFSIKVVSRNRAWYNDYTLFTTDVSTSFNSAKSNCTAAGVLLESTDTIANAERRNAVINQSIFYLKRSVSIHPKYLDAWLLLGNAYFKKNNGIDSVLHCYATILDINPMHELAFQNMQALVNRENNPDTRIYILQKMLSYQPDNYQVNYLLGKIYGKDKGDLDRSVQFLNKAAAINPNDKEAFLDLGVAFGLKHDYARSAEMLEKALTLDPGNSSILMNLGVTYQNLGKTDKAAECFRKAGAKPPKN